MVDVKVYTNGVMTQYYFNVLLDGLVWLERQLFDYIIIDNDEKVTCDEISLYIDKLNTYCSTVYGYKHDR